jgi:hypothetical protein
LIHIAEKPALIHWLLDIGRGIRVFLAFVASFQLIRSKLSFYHGAVLLMLCHLLIIPEYLMVFLRLSGRNDSKIHWEKRIKIAGSLLCVVLNLLLTAPAVELLRLGEGCILIDDMSVGSLNPKRYDELGMSPPTLYTMLLFSALDGFLIIFTVLDRDGHSEKGSWKYRAFTVTQRFVSFGIMVHLISMTISLVIMIRRLYSVRESAPEWGFTQIVTMISVGIAAVRILLQCLGRVGINISSSK